MAEVEGVLILPPQMKVQILTNITSYDMYNSTSWLKYSCAEQNIYIHAYSLYNQSDMGSAYD